MVSPTARWQALRPEETQTSSALSPEQWQKPPVLSPMENRAPMVSSILFWSASLRWIPPKTAETGFLKRENTCFTIFVIQGGEQPHIITVLSPLSITRQISSEKSSETKPSSLLLTNLEGMVSNPLTLGKPPTA